MEVGVRVVVACFGNVLRTDDGVGVHVAEQLARGGVPDGVTLLEVGIGGIHLVQELLDPADGLVVVDAVDLGRPAGTVVVMTPEVRDLSGVAPEERGDELADMHYATPARAMMLARSLGLLPERTVLVGCQVADGDGLGQALSPEVAAGIDAAAAEVRRAVSDLGILWGPRR